MVTCVLMSTGRRGHSTPHAVSLYLMELRKSTTRLRMSERNPAEVSGHAIDRDVLVQSDRSLI